MSSWITTVYTVVPESGNGSSSNSRFPRRRSLVRDFVRGMQWRIRSIFEGLPINICLILLKVC